MKNIRCPACQTVLEIGAGYTFDAKLNIICNNCEQIILATNQDDEEWIASLYEKPVQTTHNHNTTARHTPHTPVPHAHAHAHSNLANDNVRGNFGRNGIMGTMGCMD